MMDHRTARLFLVAAILGSACDSGQAPASKPEPPKAQPTAPAPAPAPTPAPAPEVRPDGPGRVDLELIRAAATAQDVKEVKIEAEANGEFRYVSVHHNDAAAIPEPVRKLLDTQFPGGKILGYETESIAGQGRLFEIEVETQDKQVCEYSARADGTLNHTECEIDARALPEPIRAAMDKAHPGVAIKEAEKKTITGAGEQYEVELEVGGKLHEYYFKPDGTQIRHELVIPAIFEITVP